MLSFFSMRLSSSPRLFSHQSRLSRHHLPVASRRHLLDRSRLATTSPLASHYLHPTPPHHPAHPNHIHRLAASARSPRCVEYIPRACFAGVVFASTTLPLHSLPLPLLLSSDLLDFCQHYLCYRRRSHVLPSSTTCLRPAGNPPRRRCLRRRRARTALSSSTPSPFPPCSPPPDTPPAGTSKPASPTTRLAAPLPLASPPTTHHHR